MKIYFQSDKGAHARRDAIETFNYKGKRFEAKVHRLGYGGGESIEEAWPRTLKSLGNLGGGVLFSVPHRTTRSVDIEQVVEYPVL